MKNFAVVKDGEIYRGGRPSGPDFSGLLQAMASVINLEGDDAAAKEAESLQALHPRIAWRWIPISLADIYIEGFPLALVRYAVAMVQSLPKPLFVHCQHGEDRTGLVIAAWRIATGWEPQRAFEEAKTHGYHTLINRGLDKTFEKLGARL